MRCHPNRPAESKTKLARPLRAVSALIVVVFMIGVVSIPAVGQGPPDYVLTWVENIWGEDNVSARDMNEAGVVVGSSDGRAFRFFENQDGSWTTEDLNDLDDIYGAFWTDLDPDSGEPLSDWIATEAASINGNGQIVGTASHVDHPNRVFVLSFPVDASPEFTLLSRFGSGNNVGTAINDDGVVVGKAGGAILFTPWTNTAFEPYLLSIDAYKVDINNKGVFVTFSGNFNNPIAASRVTPIDLGNGTYTYDGATIDTFVNRHFHGINEDGAISGRLQQLGRGNRNTIPGGPIRIDQFGVEKLLAQSGRYASQARDINNSGDVCYSVAGTPFVYITDVDEKFGLDGQIVNPDDDWLNYSIYPRAINDRGQICGVGGGKSFILTPIVQGPGITVTPTSGLTTTEAGGTDTFNVRLDSQPSDTVTVSVNSLDPTEGTTDVASLTFDQVDWNVDQPVIVTGVDDTEYDPDNTYYIEVANASSTVQVEVTNVGDDDIPPPSGSETESISYLPDGLDIPDKNSNGVISEIEFGNSYVIDGLTVKLIIRHPRPSDLIVNLYGPDDPLLLAPVRLYNFSGDNIVTEFDGQTSNGIWTLKVIDTKKKKKGTLDYWSVTVDY